MMALFPIAAKNECTRPSVLSLEYSSAFLAALTRIVPASPSKLPVPADRLTWANTVEGTLLWPKSWACMLISLGIRMEEV